MVNLAWPSCLLVCSAAAAVSAWASPVVVAGPGAFSGAETVISFDGLIPGEPLTIQYLGLGVTFAAPGLVAALDPDTAAPAAASEPGANPVILYFNAPMLRAGFDVRASTPGAGAIFLTLTVLDASLSPAGEVSFLPGAGFYDFAGLEDPAGIHGLWIGSPDPFLLANFRFEATPVPEPGRPWLLLLAGLSPLPYLTARRRKQRGSYVGPQNPLCGRVRRNDVGRSAPRRADLQRLRETGGLFELG